MFDSVCVVLRLAADQEALDLMSCLLQFQSRHRVQARRAMKHSYFSSLGHRIHMLADSMCVYIPLG